MQKINKVVNKIKSMPVAAKAALVYTIASFITRGFHLITTPLFTRIMTVEQIGIVSNFSTWESFISTIATLGLCSGAINIALKDYKEDRIGFIKNSQTLILVAVITIGFLNVAFYQQLQPIMGMPISYIIIMYVTILFNASKSFWMSLNRFEYKYKSVGIYTVLLSILSAGIAVVAVMIAKKNKIGDLASVRLYTSSAVGLLFSVPLFWNFEINRRPLINKEYCKFTVAIALPMVIHTLSKSLLSASDRAMINALCGKEAVGYYSVLYTLGSLILVIWDAINASLVPFIFKQLDKGNEGERRINSIAVPLLAIFAGCGMLMILFGPEIVDILASNKYKDAVYIMPPIATGIFFTCMYTLYANVIMYHKKTKVIMQSTMIAAIFNLITNYFFIPLYGYAAAAYTTLISYLLLAVIYRNVMIKVHERQIYSDKAIWSIGIIVIVAGFLCIILYQYTLVRYAVIALLCMIGVVKRKQIIEVIKQVRK